MKKNIIYNVAFALVMVLGMIAPDYIMRVFTDVNKAGFDVEFIAAIFVFGFTASMIMGKRFFYFSMTVFFVMQLIQIPFMTYFGRPINPIEITRVVLDFDEVLETGASRALDMWWILPMLLLTFGSVLYVYRLFYNRFVKSRFIIIVPLALLLFYPKIAYRKPPGKFYSVSPILYSLHCSMDSFSYALFNVMWATPKKVTVKKYIPYTIEKSSIPAVNNIIVIMGEAVNSSHMSLYGYHRKTSPNIDSIMLSDPNFVFKQGVACSISTVTSLPIFFNLMREPGNLEQLNKKTSNLFRLAKKAGYKTFWISAQHSKFTHEVGVRYIDETITNNNQHRLSFERKGDEALLDYLNSIQLGERNFIVIHQRCAHSPYETNYAHRRSEFEKFPIYKGQDIKERELNSYDNSILFNDFIWSSIINFASKKLKGSSCVFITSDHSELFGEGGLFGHSHLTKDCTMVPFIFYGSGVDDKIMKSIKSYKSEVTHYEIGKLIALALGFRLSNENEKDGCYFIHSNNMYIDYPFITLYRDKQTGKMICSKKVRSVSDVK